MEAAQLPTLQVRHDGGKLTAFAHNREKKRYEFDCFILQERGVFEIFIWADAGFPGFASFTLQFWPGGLICNRKLCAGVCVGFAGQEFKSTFAALSGEWVVICKWRER